MQEEMRTFGYLCPKCGKTVMAARSVFALEASNAEVACECGGSALRVEFDGQKYRAHVPCGICGETHVAVCEPERMLHGATALGCAATKQFCCFIGPEGTVEKNLRELAVLAEKEKQQEGSEEPEAFVDNVIMYEVLSELKEIPPPGPAASPAPAAAAATVWELLLCRGSGMPGLRRQAADPCRHGPGPGRSVLPYEIADPRRTVTRPPAVPA